MKRSNVITVILISILCLTFSDIAIGQVATLEYERVLLPSVIVGQLPGAHGSVWVTRIVGYNANDFRVDVRPFPSPCPILCPVPPAEASSDFVYDLSIPQVRGGGSFVYIKRPGNADVRLHLRVQDISRQSQTWGTEIPVIRESDTLTGTSYLLDVPASAEFRQNLRIYDFDGNGGTVTARIFGRHSSDPIAVAELPLLHPFGVQEDPAQASITFLTETFPQLLGESTVRIELTPDVPSLRYWAFVSVTNNETQHVTLVTPSR